MFVVLRADEEVAPSSSGRTESKAAGSREDLLTKYGLRESYDFWRRALDGVGPSERADVRRAPAATKGSDATAAEKGKKKLTTKIKIKKMRPKNTEGGMAAAPAPNATSTSSGRAMSASERAVPELTQSYYYNIFRGINGDTTLYSTDQIVDLEGDPPALCVEILPLVRPNPEQMSEFRALLTSTGIDATDIKLKPFKQSDIMCVHNMH